MARASGVIMATWEIPKQTAHLNAIIHNWLVVGNIFLSFHSVENVIIPTEFHIFQRGRYTTNHTSQ